MAAHADYVIVGGGVFGVSTALSLAETEPGVKVILVERMACPCPSAASSDLNKIIRADYDDVFYMTLALEALEKWNADPLYKPYFHKTGILFAEDIGMGHASLENYKKLGVDPGARIFTLDQAVGKFPMFRHANWTDTKDSFYNPQSGWAEADQAMRAVTDAALSAGVKYVEATVDRLIFDDQGACLGVQTIDGKEIKGRSTLLCTGAGTAKLIADSAPNNKEIQVNGRMVAAAASSCKVRCNPEHLVSYRDAPVHFLGMYHTRGESIPPTSDGTLKFNLEGSFTNMEYHEASGQTISVPPSPLGQSTWSQEVPEQLKQNLRKVIDHVFGKGAPGLTIESYRMCWDAVTPNQDWIISPHPACRGLFIAGGGSFHSWKFLPTLGKYVVRMLKGQLTPEQAQKWAWDRENGGAACVMYIPERDLKDFAGFGDGASKNQHP